MSESFNKLPRWRGARRVQSSEAQRVGNSLAMPNGLGQIESVGRRKAPVQRFRFNVQSYPDLPHSVHSPIRCARVPAGKMSRISACVPKGVFDFARTTPGEVVGAPWEYSQAR